MSGSTLKLVLAAAAFVVVAAVFFSGRVTREMPDFEVYWRAGLRAANAEPLYQTDDQHYQFKYLPAFAVLAIPLGLLPLEHAKSAWFALSIALLVALIALSLRIPPHLRKPAWVIASIVVVTMGKFYGHELVLGQINLLFAVVAVGAILALRAKRDGLSGILTAIAIVAKPYAVIFLPWLAAQRRTRAVMAAALGTAAALVLPAVTYGIDRTLALHADWWITVSTSTAPNLLNQDNVSLAAMFAKWLGPGNVASVLAAAGGVLLLLTAGVVFAARRGIAFPGGLEGALLLTLIPLLSPQGWDYVFLLATPAVVYVANYEDTLPSLLRAATLIALATIGLSLFDLLGRPNYARFMALSIITLCFLVVVAALAALRLRRIA